MYELDVKYCNSIADVRDWHMNKNRKSPRVGQWGSYVFAKMSVNGSVESTIIQKLYHDEHERGTSDGLSFLTSLFRGAMGSPSAIVGGFWRLASSSMQTGKDIKKLIEIDRRFEPLLQLYHNDVWFTVSDDKSYIEWYDRFINPNQY